MRDIIPYPLLLFLLTYFAAAFIVPSYRIWKRTGVNPGTFGGALTRKMKIARIGGYFQLLLALAGFIEVIRRFSGFGEVPAFHVMIAVSMLALAGNSICLYLLQKSKNTEAHMQASAIFTSNDGVDKPRRHHCGRARFF